MANFKDIVKEDENIVFFDTDEFAITICVDKINQIFINALFDEGREMILKNNLFGGGTMSVEPSILIKKDDELFINNKSVFEIEEKSYRKSYREVDGEMVRFYLERV